MTDSTDRLSALIVRQRKFASSKFPNETVQMKLSHLKEEIGEIADGLDIEEFADAMCLLIDSLSLAGYSLSDLMDAMDRKLTINENSKWHFAEDLGYYKRIKPNA